MGRLCERPLPPGVSRAVVGAYVRAYGVDLTDVAAPQGAYPTFDAFFTRALRPGARPVARAGVVSPADGRLVALGRFAGGTRLRVKDQDYNASDLIGEDADPYVGGSFAIVYLAPRDYHRVHAPVDGHVSLVRGISGDLYPVNVLGERHAPPLLVTNERVVVFIETTEFGRVAVVLVGAMNVGRITVSLMAGRAVPPGDRPFSPPVRVARGDEIGTFHLGSTVVLLVSGGGDLRRSLGPVFYGEGLTG